MTWKKMLKDNKGGFPAGNIITINPHVYNARIPGLFIPSGTNTQLNIHIDDDNPNVFALEITEDGIYSLSKSGFSTGNLSTMLKLKEKARFSGVVDEKGWFVFTKIEEELE